MMYEQIQIGGNDAVSFLQGQLTQDVALLESAATLPAAWCNPKGRVTALIRLLDWSETIGLAVPALLAPVIEQRLTMYRLRADVSIERSTDSMATIAAAGERAFRQLAERGLLPDANGFCSDGERIAVDFSTATRFIEVFGTRAAIDALDLPHAEMLSDPEWHRRKIHAGIATITGENSEKYTPHMLNLDRLGAISFTKGCYTGQEVVARTQNLGESKRRLQRYVTDDATLSVGDKLEDDGRSVGTVVNVAGPDLLAVTPVAIHDKALHSGNCIVNPVPLSAA